MCPMRFFLVFFSAILAGYLAWKSVSSTPELGDDSMFSDDSNIPTDDKQKFDIIKKMQNGFWVFVDMASGRYLWRNLRSEV